jgi:hypothetical protein
MLNVIKLAFQAGCGLAALGASLFFFAYKEWFKLDVFSTLTPEQTYKAFIYSLTFSLIALVVLVLAHLVKGGKSSAKVCADHNSIAVDSSGKNSNVTISKG